MTGKWVESPGSTVNAFIRRMTLLCRVDRSFEMHAVPLKGDAAPQLARCNDGIDDDATYRAACLLAEAVGVELEDG